MIDYSRPRLLRVRDVCERVGVSRSQVYRLMEKRQFPAAIKLTEGTAVWDEAEVAAWIQQQIDTAPRFGE